MKLNKRRFLSFLISFVATFLMVLIPHMKMTTKIVTPYFQHNIIDDIKPKLELKSASGYQLNKPTSLIPTVQAAQSEDLEQASAYVVVDFDKGDVIASKNLSQKLPIASLTKLMTAVVALDLASSSESFTVSEKASKQVPTKVMLKPGEKFSLEELLNSLLISSANDSAQAIEDGIDEKYGPGTFIQAMNKKATILGLKNTHFINAQGFDNPKHFSSIEDLALLSHYALTNYPLISEIVKKDVADFTRGWTDRRFYLQNWNGLLGVYPGILGVKIGNTDDAGYTTIVLSEREGKKMLAVVLGAPGVLERDMWASELLDLGFSKAYGLDPVNVTKQQLKEKYSSWVYFE